MQLTTLAASLYRFTAGGQISSRGPHGEVRSTMEVCVAVSGRRCHELESRCEPEAQSARSLILLMECRGLVEI